MRLECDCGYVATGDSDDALVGAARVHAWQVHRTELARDVILAIAGTRSTAFSQRETAPDSTATFMTPSTPATDMIRKDRNAR